jgi:hypothetical protein
MINETQQAALAAANRILACENVLDAFGHVSVRHLTDLLRFHLPRSLAPGLVTGRPHRIRQLRNRQVSGRIVLLPSETPNVAAQPAACAVPNPGA